MAEVVSPGGGEFDRRLLELSAIGHSPEEISRQLGSVLKPAQVAIRVHKLLESPDDWLSIPEQIKLILHMQRDMLGRLRDQTKGHLDKDSAKVQITLMSEIMKTLEKIQSQNTVDLNSYHANVGRAMMRAYDIALAHIGGALRDRIEPSEWIELKRESLDVAHAEVIKRQIEA